MNVLPVETLVNAEVLGQIMTYARRRHLGINAAVHELIVNGLDAPQSEPVQASAPPVATDTNVPWMISRDVSAALYKAGVKDVDDLLIWLARDRLKDVGGIGPVTEGKIVQSLIDSGLVLAVEHD